MSALVISRMAVSVLIASLFAACASNGPEQSSRSPDSAPAVRLSSASEAVSRALDSFRGYPPLHGTLVLHTSDGDLSFEMWIREPVFRVELGFAGEEPIPWVSDGTASNIREPHVHAVAFLSTDPREIFRFCEELDLLGEDEVLGRPVTGVSCRSTSGEGTYWIDVETGMVLRGEQQEDQEVSSWEFINIDLDPDFPAGVFVVPSEGT